MNLAASILVFGGGVMLVWAGIQDPSGGITGELGRVLRGESTTSRKGGGGASAANAIAAIWRDPPPASAGGTGDGGGTVTIGTATAGPMGQRVVAAAQRYLGVPYQWGGTSAKGLDCSGLVLLAHKDAGAGTVPRVAETQRQAAAKLSAGEVGPGDLAFFGLPASHVGIVTGGGQMIHAPYTGTVVKVEAITNVSTRPITYGRLYKATSGPVMVA